MSRKVASKYDNDDDDTTVNIYTSIPKYVEVQTEGQEGKEMNSYEVEEDAATEPKTATSTTLDGVLKELQRNTKAVEDMHSSVMVVYQQIADLRWDIDEERKLKRQVNQKVTPENQKRSRLDKVTSNKPPDQLTFTQCYSRMLEGERKG